MPIYEYVCQKCSVQVEDFQHITKMKKTIPCSKCGSKMQRIMSKLGFVNGGVTPKFY